MLFVPPIMQMLIFGYAVNLDVEHVKLAWMDQDRTPESRELRERFDGHADLHHHRDGGKRTGGLRHLLDRGDAQAVVRVRRASRATSAGGDAEVQILVDGTNSNTASIVGNYAGSIVASLQPDAARTPAAGEAGRPHAERPGPAATSRRCTPETRVWFNPELNSRNYFVPGVIVNIIMLVTLMLTALAIVREKEIGTMEQIMVTPIRPIELMLGKTLPFGIIGFVDMALITAHRAAGLPRAAPRQLPAADLFGAVCSC